MQGLIELETIGALVVHYSFYQTCRSREISHVFKFYNSLFQNYTFKDIFTHAWDKEVEGFPFSIQSKTCMHSHIGARKKKQNTRSRKK